MLKTEKISDLQRRHELFVRYQAIEKQILEKNRQIEKRLKTYGLLNQ